MNLGVWAFLALFTIRCLANEEDLSPFIKTPTANECNRQGLLYGRSKRIDDKCLEQCERMVHPKNIIRRKKIFNLNIIACSNHIFIRYKKSNKYNVLYLVAGEKTLLNEVKTITLSNEAYQLEDMKLAVLNQNAYREKEILIFPLFSNGDMVPQKVIQDPPNLAFATSIAFSPQNKQIFVSSGKKNAIYSYTLSSKIDRLANSWKSTPVLQLLGDVSGFENPETILTVDHMLILLDSKKRKLVAFEFPSSYSSRRPLWSYFGPDIRDISPIHVSYDFYKKSFKIFGSDGRVFRKPVVRASIPYKSKKGRKMASIRPSKSPPPLIIPEKKIPLLKTTP